MVTKTGDAQFLPLNSEDIDDISFDPISKTETEFDKKVEDFASSMSDLGNNGEILVKRQTGGGKDPMEHVGYFEPDEYSYGQLVEHLRNNYGGGLYRIYLRVNGRNKGNSLVRIAESKSTPENSRALAGHGELSQILNVMREQNNQLMDAMKQPQKDPMADMMQMFQMMTMMREAMGIQNQTPVNPLEQLKDSMSILEGFGVTINGQAEKDEDDGFGGLIEKMAPLVTAAIQPKQSQPQQNPKSREKPMFGNIMLKAGINTLLKAAKKGSDPATYAEMILDQLPEDKVREFITSENSAKKLVEIVPQVGEFAEWFDTLSEHVKAQLGMESTVSDLYGDDENVINAETVTVDENDASGATSQI